jgi:hypothetical protein
MINRVAFFHGLESSPKSDKNESLHQKFDFVYDPPMNYRDNGLFDKVLSDVKKNKIDLLIGSSMGGWFAYCISTITGIPTLLFNPAFHSRIMEPQVRVGNKKSKHTLVLGASDKVIPPMLTQNWTSKEGIGSFKIYYESIEHRTPIDIFNKWLDIETAKLNEEWSTESPGNLPDWSFLPIEAVQTLIPNFLAKRPPVGNLVVEDDSEIEDVRKAQKNLSDDDIGFIKDAHNSPPQIFYQWLVLRGEKPKMSELNDYWNYKKNLDMIGSIKKMTKRLRPYQKYDDVKIPTDIDTEDFSFPSGHSYGAYFIASKLSQKYPHLVDGLFLLADRIAKSRIQAGVHYPSDVEAGKLLALKMSQTNF